MMMTRLILMALPFARAFSPGPLPRLFTRDVSCAVVQDEIKFDSRLAAKEVDRAGVSAPLGFFDPLGFYNGKTVREKKKLREAELKHGRVAMLAALGILVQEVWHPLISGDVGIAVNHYYEVQAEIPDFWVVALITLSLFEFKAILKGWDPVEETLERPKIAGLRDEYVAGDLDFDPFALCPEDDELFLNMRTKELNNGRLAMIAAFGLIGQELATRIPVMQGLLGSSSYSPS